ncbi:hypothetical protein MtrunA17_Chr8g0393071 [Medicago truncatula]|uniref:Nuclear localized protein, putative n=1 Tax=Medicago truncatula TaxID=3880 RepID=G7LE64_MEDTR|nr:uncharacterized protein LOC11407596 isoform X2 [Medicago truncatula]AET05596.2 nuclear localized protein, putative [Medicago truncatula]RHN43922.1 hypothetical protein MtrunA17_Chr8g0393071 [Medicago truncatula]
MVCCAGWPQPKRKRRKSICFPREGFLDLGAKMETEEPWESLDIDDSDLSNFLRPCNHHRITDTPLIPGPAGAVQSAMIQRRTLGSSNTLPTQELVRHVLQNGHDSDLDFNSNPWLSAQVHVESVTPLNSIKKHLNGEGKVPSIVAVIKSCTPNGFGDMTVTLKDPTGSVGASIHRKVFTEGGFRKDITVGSVLLLQKVAVFSPNGSTCYLNITLSNILKVFSKDSGPPSQQISAIRTTPISGAERQEKSWMPPSSVLSLPQERTQGILNNLRVESRFREVADRENLSLRQDIVRPVEAICGGDLESEMEDQQNHPNLGKGDSLVGNDQANSSSSNSAHISADQETGIENHMETQEIMNPKSSIPQWTDEQLNELLSFD